MAGRGCTIIIKLLGGANGQGDIEELSLPVALHSPLHVLRDQLFQIVRIAPPEQVLILCDLSDPDRNSDVLLNGRDFMTLSECGITSGSVLTLHALGLSAEKKQTLLVEAFSNKAIENHQNIQVLETDISPEEADHSYNGVIFDIECNGPYEIDLHSISIGGMLGRVRIYARDRPWEADKPTTISPHWWAHQSGLSTVGWQCIADVNCRPSWDKPLQIAFSKPCKLAPHERKALYCHSNLPDDLGIQYQSYQQGRPCAHNTHLTLYPGLGHTGSEPFDQDQGWYRANRGLAGSLAYTVTWSGWTPFVHRRFPLHCKQAVLTMLLCQQHYSNQNFALSASSSSSSSSASASAVIPMLPQYTLGSLPVAVIYHILEFMHYDWFCNLELLEAEDNHKSSSRGGRTGVGATARGGDDSSRANLLARIFEYFGHHGTFQELMLGGEDDNDDDNDALLDEDDVDDGLEYMDSDEEEDAEEDEDVDEDVDGYIDDEDDDGDNELMEEIEYAQHPGLLLQQRDCILAEQQEDDCDDDDDDEWTESAEYDPIAQYDGSVQVEELDDDADDEDEDEA